MAAASRGAGGKWPAHDFAFGTLAAASMLAVAVGAGASPQLRRGLGLRVGYLAALDLVAICTALLVNLKWPRRSSRSTS